MEAEAAERAQRVRSMFDRISGRYDALNRLLTLGLDSRWRRRTVSELGLPPGSRVADLACGTGDLCLELDRQGYEVTGFDFAPRMLAIAARRTHVPLVRADILALPVAGGCFDGATCGFALRNVTDIDACFAEMARVVRPGGRVALLEVAEPASRPLRAVHALYFRHVVPAVGGLLSDRDAYRYLPDSASWLPPPGRLRSMLREAGFAEVSRLALGGGAAQLLTATRR